MQISQERVELQIRHAAIALPIRSIEPFECGVGLASISVDSCNVAVNKHYDQFLCFSATGVSIGSILALIVALAISLVFDVEPADASTGAKRASTASIRA